MIKDVEFEFKDEEGYTNRVVLKDIIVISDCAKEGTIAVETCKHGVFVFTVKDDIGFYADRIFTVSQSELYVIASRLDLVEMK